MLNSLKANNVEKFILYDSTIQPTKSCYTDVIPNIYTNNGGHVATENVKMLTIHTNLLSIVKIIHTTLYKLLGRKI